MRALIVLSIVACACACACGNDPKPAAKSPTGSQKTFLIRSVRPAPDPGTSEGKPVSSANVTISSEIARLCNITTFGADTAPKFAFDDSTLTPDDHVLLDQIGRCMLTGPLSQRSILLTGRADPRGETEYNMSLGSRRANSAREYLREVGVSPTRISETSRGALDATGIDEPSWALDRRVDISLI